jgi:carbon-monoxide dehydrogenase medium subunit
MLADPSVRNVGTIGGNLCHRSPENDLPAVAVALDATLRLLGPDGAREVSAADFFGTDTAAGPRNAEILTEVRFPVPAAREGAAYEKAQHKTGDPAVAGAAARVRLGERGAIDDAAVVLTNAGPVAWRSEGAREALVGHLPSEERLRDAAARTAEDARPPVDLRGPAAYKRAVVRLVTGLALERALARAGGGPS